jgi:hypothetical protein
MVLCGGGGGHPWSRGGGHSGIGLNLAHELLSDVYELRPPAGRLEAGHIKLTPRAISLLLLTLY